MPEKTKKNSWSPWSQSGGWKGRTMEERVCGKVSFKPGVEERTYNGWWQWWWRKWRTDVKSHEILYGRSSWSARWRSSLGRWFQRQQLSYVQNRSRQEIVLLSSIALMYDQFVLAVVKGCRQKYTTSSPWTVTLSWQHTTYKMSRAYARLQVSMYSGYDLHRPG